MMQKSRAKSSSTRPRSFGTAIDAVVERIRLGRHLTPAEHLYLVRAGFGPWLQQYAWVTKYALSHLAQQIGWDYCISFNCGIPLPLSPKQHHVCDGYECGLAHVCMGCRGTGHGIFWHHPGSWGPICPFMAWIHHKLWEANRTFGEFVYVATEACRAPVPTARVLGARAAPVRGARAAPVRGAREATGVDAGGVDVVGPGPVGQLPQRISETYHRMYKIASESMSPSSAAVLCRRVVADIVEQPMDPIEPEERVDREDPPPYEPDQVALAGAVGFGRVCFEVLVGVVTTAEALHAARSMVAEKIDPESLLLMKESHFQELGIGPRVTKALMQFARSGHQDP